MGENVATGMATSASTNLDIVLASGSPRRQQFLGDLGLDFTVTTADIDETPLPNESPVELVRRLAESKAEAVIQKLPDSKRPRLLIAADTIVALGDELLGKPVDAEDAMTTLGRLRNRAHQVISCFSMVHIDASKAVVAQKTVVNSSDLHMRSYTDQEIATYVATGDPLDKAGSYAIQHPNFAPGEKLDGCISSVMGLPLADLVASFAEFGVTIHAELPTLCEQHAGFPCCQR